jgi:hypothetical protein
VKPIAATLPGISKIVIHENQSYAVIVDTPPATPDMPNPIPAYVIVNKETGVWESWTGLLYYAKDMADQFHKQLTRPQNEKVEEAQQQKFSFN